jgi:hypothetical protein
MEVLKGFDEYQSNKKSFDTIIEKLESEKEKIDNQIHIFKVLEVASKMQNLINDEIISKLEISTIILGYGYDYDYGNEVLYDFQDSEGSNEFKKYLPSNIRELIDNNFRILNGFKTERISNKFSQREDIIVNIEEDFREKFIDLMLSGELKSMLNYSLLQNELPGNSGKTTKVKI